MKKNVSEKKLKKDAKDLKLPLINKNKKNDLIKQSNTTTNKNKENTTLSKMSRNSTQTKSNKTSNTDDLKKKLPQNKNIIKSNTLSDKGSNLLNHNRNKKDKSKNNKDKNRDKINDIINNFNKEKNINTKVIKSKNSLRIELPFKIKNKLESPNKKTINNKKYKYAKYKSLDSYISHHDNNSFNQEHKAKDNYDEKHSSISMPRTRLTKNDLQKIKNRRNLRIQKENLEYQKILKSLGMNFEQNSYKKNKDKDFILNKALDSMNIPLKISHRKAQKILEDEGMIEAYKYLINNLCKNGIPEGNIYDYCSEYIRNFEKVWQKIKFRKLNKEIEEHFKKEKEDLIKKNQNISTNIHYKALIQREEIQFIKKLDKSRSSLHILKRQKTNDENNKNNNNDIKNINQNAISSNNDANNNNNIINNNNDINNNNENNINNNMNNSSNRINNNQNINDINKDNIITNNININATINKVNNKNNNNLQKKSGNKSSEKTNNSKPKSKINKAKLKLDNLLPNKLNKVNKSNINADSNKVTFKIQLKNNIKEDLKINNKETRSKSKESKGKNINDNNPINTKNLNNKNNINNENKKTMIKKDNKKSINKKEKKA